jgi:hypothetical protein
LHNHPVISTHRKNVFISLREHHTPHTTCCVCFELFARTTEKEVKLSELN